MSTISSTLLTPTNADSLIKEQGDLSIRIIGLTGYMESTYFEGCISKDEKRLIHEQLAAMEMCSRILHKRILAIAMRSNIIVNRTV